MPLVKPNYPNNVEGPKTLEPGRYTVRVMEAKESDHLDKGGNNALVVKMEVVNSRVQGMNGKRVSKWLPLGGAGSKVLYRFMKCLDSNYRGQAFTTESLIGQMLEVDVVPEVNPKDGKTWIKVDKMFPYLQPGSVAASFAGNVQETSADFDTFDRA